MNLYQKLFYDDQVFELCSAERFVAFLVEAEGALVKAQGRHGIILADEAARITKIFEHFKPDMVALQSAIPLAGNAAAPLVKQLVSAVAKVDEKAAKYIHLGATSQDIVDTANVLKLKAFITYLETALTAITAHLRSLSLRYRNTPMIGRTLMQHARPITFGLKTAYWLRSIEQVANHLAGIKKQVLVAQLGGAVGSRNEYLTAAVQQTFAQTLGLTYGPAWHTNRVSLNLFTCCLGTLAGCLGKIANEIILMAQTEVGELSEPAHPGRGTSSTMPHKRNPVLSTTIAANSQRIPLLVAGLLGAMSQAHERAAGNWHAEWEPLDELLRLTAGSISRIKELLAGLEVNEKRMRQNIELSGGFVFAESVALALAPHLGRQKAHTLVKAACVDARRNGQSLRQTLSTLELPLSNAALAACFDAANAIGFSTEIIDQILADQ